MDNFLIPFLLILVTVAVLPSLVIIIILTSGLGVFNWLVIAGMISPVAIIWYIVVRRRIINSLQALLASSPKEWDIEKAFDEYEKLLRKDDQWRNIQMKPPANVKGVPRQLAAGGTMTPANAATPIILKIARYAPRAITKDEKGR